jgi:hypothetical protein
LSLSRQVDAVWSLCWYPDAGEAGGAFVPARPYARGGGRRGQAKDPERARRESARRARGRLRRYCAANRLNRLGTLTYAGEGCHDPRQVRADVARFFRELRRGLDGAQLPYVWVPEWHKSGHGLHLHFAIGRFVQRQVIARAWGHGFVHIKLLGDLPVGAGTLAQARKAAGYLSKYVTKDFEDVQRPAGFHRFDVAEGHQPRCVRLTGRSADDVIGQASAAHGARPVLRWSSAEVPDWHGGPAIWAQWA